MRPTIIVPRPRAAVLAICLTLVADAAAQDRPPGGAAQALITAARADLKSGTIARRVAACRALGELGPAATAARPELCLALIDPQPRVQNAAADALRQIDRPFADLAVTIARGRNLAAVREAAGKGVAVQELAPLILEMARSIAPGAASTRATVEVRKLPAVDAAPGANPLADCLTALSLVQPRPTTEVFQFILTMARYDDKRYVCPGIDPPQRAREDVRRVALVALGDLPRPDVPPPEKPASDSAISRDSWRRKYEAWEAARDKAEQEFVDVLIAAARSDVSANRVAAIRALARHSQPRTRTGIRRALEPLRDDPDAAVRPAAVEALRRL